MKDRPARAGALEVTSLEQLAALADLRSWRWLLPAAPLSLRLPLVGRALQETAERRLNFLGGVCGCHAGGLLALAALAWCIVSPAQESNSTLWAVLRAAGFVVGAGILGKALAVLSARAMFMSEATLLVWRARRAMQRRITP